MRTVTTHDLGYAKSNKRLWLNSRLVEGSGFKGGQALDIEYDEGCVVIRPSEGKSRNHVSDSHKGLIIDLNNGDLSKAFSEYNRVNVEWDSEKQQLVVRGHQAESKILERESTIKRRVQTGQPLRAGGLFAGVGLLCRSIHRGFKSAGVSVQQRFGNELESIPAEVSLSNEIWQEGNRTDDALLVQDDIWNLDLRSIPKLDLLCAGFPCTPFSKLNTHGRKSGRMDIYHEAAMVFQPMLSVINISNPAAIVIENSDMLDSEDSVVNFILNETMTRLGYLRSDVKVTGTAFGGFEPRSRLCRVYYSRNLDSIDMALLAGDNVNERTLADVLEPMDDADKRWAPRPYLERKDAQTHNGHSLVVCKPEDRKTPTIPACYGRVQPDTPLIAHPDYDQNKKLRILTPSEHCNVRRIDGEFKEAVVAIAEGTHPAQKSSRTSVSAAHRMLGNSCSPEPWEAVGKAIGLWLQRIAGGVTQPKPTPVHAVPAPVPAPSPAANETYVSGQQISLFI